jgi:hypothetical protein
MNFETSEWMSGGRNYGSFIQTFILFALELTAAVSKRGEHVVSHEALESERGEKFIRNRNESKAGALARGSADWQPCQLLKKMKASIDLTCRK